MILKQLSLSLENISFIYYAYNKMSNNNLPNTWNSKKNIEHIITAARDYDAWHINEEELVAILQECNSSNDWDRMKKHIKALPSDNTNTHESHQED